MQKTQTYGATGGGGAGLPNGLFYGPNGRYAVVASGTNGPAAAKNAFQGNRFGAVGGGSTAGGGRTDSYGATGTYADKPESNCSTPPRTKSLSPVKTAQSWYGR